MPLTGHLPEFPLPEVLLLIGSRTGRLRLYDAQDYIPMELDLAEGRAHSLHIGAKLVTTSAQVIAELSFVVETGEGSFQFTPRPIAKAEHSLPISELVMQLVLHVDEKQAKRHAVTGPELFYILEPDQPIADLSPDLYKFFRQSRQLLADGVRADDLAEYLGEVQEVVMLNLYDLHQFGFVKLVETNDVQTLREMILKQEIAQMSDDFFLPLESPLKTVPGPDKLLLDMPR